ncbi:MAG: DUF2807 domain-containing protein [Chloroflexia bacterium]|nr:DUF2807 domain-containing protein [Chloroflexia bacterium]
MKQRCFSGIVLCALLLAAWNCGLDSVRGSGQVVERDREVGSFRGVELATIGTLYIEVGEREGLRIEAEDNILPYIETKVRDDVLIISADTTANIRPRKSIQYYLTVEELDTIILSSVGNVEAPDLESKHFMIRLSSTGNLTMGDLEADTLVVNLSSTGSLEMDKLQANRLEVTINSTGNVSIDGGEVEEQTVTLSSTGDYEARRLDSERATVKISSTGSATIRVSEELTADLTSTGSLYYAGEPRVDANVTSTGNLERLDD